MKSPVERACYALGWVALLLIVAAFASAAQAQSVTRNCITQTCALVTGPQDVSAAAAQPVQCRLYDGAALLETVAVGGTATARTCTFAPRNFAAGSHTLTAKFVAADGSESDPSNVVTLTSALPARPPAPTNLRFI